MTQATDQELQGFAREQLERHAAQLDDATRRRLRTQRQEALQARPPRHTPWHTPWMSAAVVGTLVLAVALFLWQSPDTRQEQAPPAAMAQSDEHDLMENWEFYEWLETVELSQPESPQPSHSSLYQAYFV